jgi:pyridoxal phosphate enzyme (YggS family)
LPLADIQTNLANIRQRIDRACQRAGRSPDSVTLITVTKTIDAPVVEAAFTSGLRDFGENRVQEAGRKIKQLSYLQPRPHWHLIGHLQSNKVKSAVEIFDVIHSVDSLSLAEEINRRTPARKPVLLQVNVAAEDTKSGFLLAEIESAFKAISIMPGLQVCGLMTIAPLVKNAELVRPVFRRLRELRDTFHLEHLSMGMTDDFEVAIEEGATLIRVGRAIFGERR